MEAKLIKIDRNGSKHYEGMVTCDRCGGDGIYKWGAMIYEMGSATPRPQYAGVCFKCGGEGKVWGKWIERTPEYQAKLDARREAKHRAQAEEEAKRKAEEERIKAEKAISQYVGTVGDKYNATVTYEGSAHFEVNSFRGYGTDTMYVHFFKDADGNKLVWKTASALGKWLDNGDWLHYEEGDTVTLKGTIKEHKEYRDEKQTVLTRCKMEWKGA